MTRRPHVLGIDEGPFQKGQSARVPVVAALCEVASLLEAVARTDFPVDGPEATQFLVEWIGGLRATSALQGNALGGITFAGLGVVDVRVLSDALAAPVLVVTRRPPDNARLHQALDAAGLLERYAIAERSPRAFRTDDGVWLAFAGCERERAQELLRETRGKAKLPEPLRNAHLIATAYVRGESYGRA